MTKKMFTAEENRRIMALARETVGPEATKTKYQQEKEHDLGGEAMTFARAILRHGTPEEIEAVENGQTSIHSLGLQIRNKVPANKRWLSTDDSPVFQEELEQRKMRGKLWTSLKQALVTLSEMPNAADMLGAIYANDRYRVVASHLPNALKFLKELENVYGRKATISSQAHGHHAGNSDGDARAQQEQPTDQGEQRQPDRSANQAR